MSILLYDLAGADPELRFSPYCWRTKMALRHKGLDFETVPWRFTEKEVLAPSGQGRVPVIVDSGRWVSDSWTIAGYLDEAYPDRPPLFPDARAKAQALFVNAWCDGVIAAARPLVMPHLYGLIAERDKAYFKESREARFGPMDGWGEGAAAAAGALVQARRPAEAVLAGLPFLSGDQPGYADYALFGTLKWPDTICPQPVLAPGSTVQAWYERMAGHYGGYAASAPTARTLAG
jgi:glutathione S-transferase